VAVDIYPPNASLIAQPDPKDQLQAKFSAPFAIGLVLAGHDPEDVRLPKKWLVDPKVRRWYPAISVRADSEVPRRHARVTVAWHDGAEESADRPLRNLDEKEVWSRFSAAARRYLGEGAHVVEDAVADRAALSDTRGLPLAVRKAIGV
jgi:2-methylcitrate dehydratase PrpD